METHFMILKRVSNGELVFFSCDFEKILISMLRIKILLEYCVAIKFGLFSKVNYIF